MGRPPLGVKSTHVRLPNGVADRIDALVGRQRRAAFIREAVEAELDRRAAGANGAPARQDGSERS